MVQTISEALLIKLMLSYPLTYAYVLSCQLENRSILACTQVHSEGERLDPVSPPAEGVAASNNTMRLTIHATCAYFTWWLPDYLGS